MWIKKFFILILISKDEEEEEEKEGENIDEFNHFPQAI